MELSGRLGAIAAMVPEVETVADIGCDHGKLAVWLVKNGRARHAVCCDISQKSLKKAEKLAASEGLRESISVRLGSGFDMLAAGEAQAAVVAGMGGELIASIIEAGMGRAPDTLVLSCHTAADYLRRWLSENGFYFEDEALVAEKGHFYPVMRLRRGAGPALGDMEAELGPVLLRKKPAELGLLVRYRINKTLEIRDQLEKSGSPRKDELLREIDMKMEKYTEVERCLSR